MEKFRAARSDENVFVAVRQRAKICLCDTYRQHMHHCLGGPYREISGHSIPKQQHKIKLPRPQVCEPTSPAPLDRVNVRRSVFTLRSIVDSEDLWRSVHGISGAGGQFFGVVWNGLEVLNG